MKQLTGVDQALRQGADAKQVPGVVAMAVTDSEIIYQGAFGKRDLGKPDAMTLDTVFWIASMTKAITGAAAMQLVEQGKLSLDAPIGKVLPEIAAMQVFEGFDASGKPKLRAAKRPITLKHLLTHTAGYCYNIWNAEMGKYMEHAGIPGITIETPRGEIQAMDPAAFRLHFSVAPPDVSRGMRLAAIRFAVRDIGVARGKLGTGATERMDKLIIAPQAAHGATLVFEPARR
jgi:hypothetical protein